MKNHYLSQVQKALSEEQIEFKEEDFYKDIEDKPKPKTGESLSN